MVVFNINKIFVWLAIHCMSLILLQQDASREPPAAFTTTRLNVFHVKVITFIVKASKDVSSSVVESIHKAENVLNVPYSSSLTLKDFVQLRTVCRLMRKDVRNASKTTK